MKIEIRPDMAFQEGVIIPIDKPYGWTSSDVVRKMVVFMRRLGHRKIKVGHAGTLDPLATGVLLICLGRATKQADALQAEAKEYVAEITIGATTPSFDMEHPVDHHFPYEHITESSVIEGLNASVGEQDQVPPIYSAKSIDGKRAYEYAREGEPVQMRVAQINIYAAELLKFDLPRLTVRLECSKGTYVRSYARDLGLSLESGGYLSALRRTRSGNYTADNCLSIEQLELMLFPDSTPESTEAYQRIVPKS